MISIKSLRGGHLSYALNLSSSPHISEDNFHTNIGKNECEGKERRGKKCTIDACCEDGAAMGRRSGETVLTLHNVSTLLSSIILVPTDSSIVLLEDRR